LMERELGDWGGERGRLGWVKSETNPNWEIEEKEYKTGQAAVEPPNRGTTDYGRAGRGGSLIATVQAGEGQSRGA